MTTVDLLQLIESFTTFMNLVQFESVNMQSDVR